MTSAMNVVKTLNTQKVFKDTRGESMVILPASVQVVIENLQDLIIFKTQFKTHKVTNQKTKSFKWKSED